MPRPANKGTRVVLNKTLDLTIEVVITGIVKDGQVVDFDYSFHPYDGTLGDFEQMLVSEAEYAGGDRDDGVEA